MGRCLACARVSKHLLFAFEPADVVCSEMLVVFARSDFAAFAVLSSEVHRLWAREAGLASTLETRGRYTPSTCFETFPFPRPNPAQQLRLLQTGEALYVARTAAQRRLQLGLTKLWNRVEDPSDDDPILLELRQLRAALNTAVYAAYGWEEAESAEILRRLRALNAARSKEK